MTEKFQVQFLEDAAEFLDNLDERAREKKFLNKKVKYHEKGSIEDIQFGRNVGQTYR